MTTLPQTTPARMPRTVAPGQIAIPGLPNGAGGGGGGITYGPHLNASGGTGTGQLTGADVLRVLRANWWLLAAMFVVGVVGGYFLNRYLLQHHPKYTANALLRVETVSEMSPGATSGVADRSNLELEQLTQVANLTHPTLLSTVLQNSPEIRATSWFQQFRKGDGYDVERAKASLAKIFDVSPVANSRLIRLNVTWENPRDTKTILYEIVEEHIKQQKNNVSADFKTRAKNLYVQSGLIQGNYDQAKEQLARMATLLGPDGSILGQSNIKQMELSYLMRDLARAEQEYNDAKSEYEGIDSTMNRGGVPATAQEVARRHPLYTQYRAMVDEIDVTIKAEMTRGADNNTMQSLQKRRQGYEDKLNQLVVEQETRAADDLRAEAKSKLDRMEKTLKRINDEVGVVKADLSKLSGDLTKYQRIAADERDYKEKLNKVQDDLQEIERLRLPLEWSPVKWAQQPLTPETPSFPRLPFTVGLSVVLCLGLGLGIAFLRELTDTTVRSPRDIQRVGQMNLLGTVPHEADDPQAAGARVPLLIFDAPYSMAAEEFRKIRTRLQHMASLDTTRSIVVTGAGAGDGKTTVACNLAAGLALNGRRILLVDANFRRPELHKVFGLENGQGFGDVLNAPEYFDTVVQGTPIPNLSVVTAGTKPSNATELLESQLLIDFIERALDEYDHVVFDSGSVLMASETLALAPRVDGVITVVRARANNRGVLQRMRETLRQVKAEHLGVVLNAVRAQAGGYYGRSIVDYYKYSNGHANGTAAVAVNGNGHSNGSGHVNGNGH